MDGGQGPARASRNPVADLISVSFQNNTNLGLGFVSVDTPVWIDVRQAGLMFSGENLVVSVRF